MSKVTDVDVEVSAFFECFLFIYLTGQLNRIGHPVEFQEIIDFYVVELHLLGELVYKCDIRKLDFGMF